MDLTDPVRAVIPTLDGPVLGALAGTTEPMTGRQVHRVVGSGSEAGVRRCLGRLVEQGVVTSTQAGQARLYVGNRDHVAWPAIEALTDLRHLLRSRITDELETWRPAPLVAGVFGSAARRDGRPDSDIDLLLVHDGSGGGDSMVAQEWEQQVATLGRHITAWSGNEASPLVVSREEAVEIVATEALGEAWLREVDVLVGHRWWRDILRSGLLRRRDADTATVTG